MTTYSHTPATTKMFSQSLQSVLHRPVQLLAIGQYKKAFAESHVKGIIQAFFLSFFT